MSGDFYEFGKLNQFAKVYFVNAVEVIEFFPVLQ